mgnify:CR=1 FL=1
MLCRFLVGRSVCLCGIDVERRVLFFQAEDGIRDLVRSRGLGDVYKRQVLDALEASRKAGKGLHLRHRIEHAQVLDPADIPLSLIHI